MSSHITQTVKTRPSLCAMTCIKTESTGRRCGAALYARLQKHLKQLLLCPSAHITQFTLNCPYDLLQLHNLCKRLTQFSSKPWYDMQVMTLPGCTLTHQAAHKQWCRICSLTFTRCARSSTGDLLSSSDINVLLQRLHIQLMCMAGMLQSSTAHLGRCFAS